MPTQFKLLLADPKLAGADLSSLRIVVSSGSRLPPETKAEILKRMTRGLMELYGMTEGVATVLEPEQMEEKACFGRARDRRHGGTYHRRSGHGARPW